MAAIPEKPEFVLDTDVQFIKGVGERRAAVLKKAGIENLETLLENLPRRYLDRSNITLIAEALPNAELTIVGEVVSSTVVRYGKKRLVVKIKDASGAMEALWFNPVSFFTKLFKPGQTVALSGKVSDFRRLQMVHPDFDIVSEQKEALNTGQIISVYKSSQPLKQAGLNNYALRRIIAAALKTYSEGIPDNLTDEILKQYQLPDRVQAFNQAHFPDNFHDVRGAIRRFKFEELFFLQVLVAMRRRMQRVPGGALPIELRNRLYDDFLLSLPFELTPAQRRVLNEVKEDLLSGYPLNRLLQGDVGSGKTVVAVGAMIMAVSSGYQAAIMVPTEILAGQHYANFQQLLQGSGCSCVCLLGSMKSAEKKEAYARIADGSADIIIGTHALIQSGVDFANLGLVVVDEQHRFGVLQRAALMNKGKTPHTLVMTATPIPRTLALTIYGDLEVSVIDELPPGRRVTRTFWRTEGKLPLIFDFIDQRVAAGEQAYVVYPMVEESDKIELKAATERYEHLRERFAEHGVGLLHGQMSTDEKEHAMSQFKSGSCRILVATTVVEVGVDIPQATVIVIEHAERFGLSQLHQLRGRVGRSGLQAYCIMVTPANISEVARKRMEIMTRSNDGFVIAEEDLKIRGGGDFFGTRQHGMPELKYADLAEDQRIVEVARKTAFELIETDPHLRKVQHQEIRRHFQRRFADKLNLSEIA